MARAPAVVRVGDGVGLSPGTTQFPVPGGRPRALTRCLVRCRKQRALARPTSHTWRPRSAPQAFGPYSSARVARDVPRCGRAPVGSVMSPQCGGVGGVPPPAGRASGPTRTQSHPRASRDGVAWRDLEHSLLAAPRPCCFSLVSRCRGQDCDAEPRIRPVRPVRSSPCGEATRARWTESHREAFNGSKRFTQTP